jgi:peptidoglycan/LPS O-acetylase OafA/YrhL
MSLKYMKQLDGLRAFAVFTVLYVHYLPDESWNFPLLGLLLNHRDVSEVL